MATVTEFFGGWVKKKNTKWREIAQPERFASKLESAYLLKKEWLAEFG
jgi:hypothetical protein